jgi:hypothetical protein
VRVTLKSAAAELEHAMGTVYDSSGDQQVMGDHLAVISTVSGIYQAAES